MRCLSGHRFWSWIVLINRCFLRRLKLRQSFRATFKLYLQAALEHLQSEGLDTHPEDRARLSPLQHRHLNVLGRFSFALADPIASGKLRPLNIEGEDEEA